MNKGALDSTLKNLINKQFNTIYLLQAKNKLLPISYSQVFFWALCLIDNHPKNEATGRYLWGEIDIEKLNRSYNKVLQDNDVFHFKFRKYLPLAKLEKPAKQKITYYDLSKKTKEEKDREVSIISKNLETMDLRFERVCHAVIIKLNPYKYLMLAAFSHTLIDTTSKNLFWRYLFNNYSNNNEDIEKMKPDYLDYICVERAFHDIHLQKYQSMFDVHYDEIPIALFPSNLFDPTENILKPRIFTKINRELVLRLKSNAQQKKLSFETLLMGIFLKAVSKYMSNGIALVQNINISIYPELFENTCGPHLQESILIFTHLKESSIQDIAEEAKEQIWSQPFHSLPFSFGLGVILDRYLPSVSFSENILFELLKIINPIFLRRLMIPNDILLAYRGLMKFDGYNKHHRNKLIIMNFNFRYDLAVNVLPHDTVDINAERGFLHPFYTKPNDYLVFNFDSEEDESIIFHMESPFSDASNSELSKLCLYYAEQDCTIDKEN